MRGSSVKRGSRIRDFDNHSPMFMNRHFNEERRSRLFGDRPFIWGRLPKYLIAWCFAMQFWAGYYLYHKNSLKMYLLFPSLTILGTCRNSLERLTGEQFLLSKLWRTFVL